MSFPAYPEYTESGVEWLGEVPAGWDILPLRRVAQLLTDKASGRELAIGLEDIEGWTGRLDSRGSEYEGEGVAFGPGDVLYGKLRPYLAKVWAASVHGAAVGDFHVLRPAGVDADFLVYCLLTRGAVSILDGATHGAKMPRVGWEALASLGLPQPSMSEQRTIAAFLDRETARIDAAVAAQERLIALLAEKRAATISHAVTKGLDPNAPMKDSGIEWLGQIPAHWQIHALARVVDQFVDYRGKTPTKTDSGVPLITAAQIKGGKLDHSLDPAYISEEEYVERMTRGLPKRGDLLLTTEAPLGEAALVEDETISPGQRIILMKPNENLISGEYLLAHFLSDFGQSELWTRASGSTASGIRADRLRASHVVVPPVSEQEQIVELVGRISDRTSRLLGKSEGAILLLKERRAALISAAVTGKIDVRGEMAATTQEAA